MQSDVTLWSMRVLCQTVLARSVVSHVCGKDMCQRLGQVDFKPELFAKVLVWILGSIFPSNHRCANPSPFEHVANRDAPGRAKSEPKTEAVSRVLDPDSTQ